MLRMAAAALCVSAAMPAAFAGPAKVIISNNSGDSAYFQPEGSLGYNEVEPGSSVVEVDDLPAYYFLMDADGSFHPVFLTPDSETRISVDAGGKVSISGGNEGENRFLADNRYLVRAPKSIKKYSPQWVEYQNKEIQRLDSLLDASGLDPRFVSLQKLHYEYALLNEKLGGMTIYKLFSNEGDKTEIDGHFYDFLNSLSFDDPSVVRLPKWFDVVLKALETKEQLGLIPVDNDTYMSVYASAIADPVVRSHFLVSLLERVLKYNYINDYEAQLPDILPMITDDAALARLDAVRANYAERKAAAANVTTGTPMPECLCRDVNGKEYRLSDLKGNYVVVDFCPRIEH